MKTPKQPLLLNQLLFPLGTSVNILSHKTGIAVERLEQMFALANGTEEELAQVALVLERPLATIKQVFSHQAGNYNQAGKNQRQRINTRDKRTTIKVKNLNVYIHVVSPNSQPASEGPSSHIKLPQQEKIHQLLLGDEALQVGRSLSSGTHGI